MCFPCSHQNCKSFIKVDGLQWTETDEAWRSMFLLEITPFVCSVQLKKEKKTPKKLYSHKQFKHWLSCQFNRNRPADATHPRTAHRSQRVSLQHFISLSLSLFHTGARYHLTTYLLTSTCFNTAAATKSREDYAAERIRTQL